MKIAEPSPKLTLTMNDGRQAPVKVFARAGGLAVVMPELLTYDDNVLKRWAAVVHVATKQIVLTTKTVLGARRVMAKLNALQDWTGTPGKPAGFDALAKQYRTR